MPQRLVPGAHTDAWASYLVHGAKPIATKPQTAPPPTQEPSAELDELRALRARIDKLEAQQQQQQQRPQPQPHPQPPTTSEEFSGYRRGHQSGVERGFARAAAAAASASASGGARSPTRGLSPPTLRRRRTASEDQADPLKASSKYAVNAGDIFAKGSKTAGSLPPRPPSRAAAAPIAQSMRAYFVAEIFSVGHRSTDDEQVVEANMKNFLRVPYSLERVMVLGLFVSLDTFLHVVTFLPLRVGWSGYLLVRWVAAGGGGLGAAADDGTGSPRPHPWTGFHRSHAFDLLRGLTVFLCLVALQSLKMSRVYHWIRGQQMIKIYVMTGMLEVISSLLSAFGQDALDSLYYATAGSKKPLTRVLLRPWLVTHLVVTVAYVTLHSMVLFVHLATLNVAANTANQALVTLLIANNFSEMKSVVFKKFDKSKLFQLACADVVERFKLGMFMGLLLLLNWCQSPDNSFDAFWAVLNVSFYVFVAEILADWVKHSFVCKYNHIDASAYAEFELVLVRDVLGGPGVDDGVRGIGLDQTLTIVRRLGMPQLPLACVIMRYLQITVTQLVVDSEVSLLLVAVATAFLFAGLVVLKTVTGLITYRLAEATLQHEGPCSPASTPARRISVQHLAGVERYAQRPRAAPAPAGAPAGEGRAVRSKLT